ncbi:hypothetical protein NA78x_001972 [Anatilimnocola sp. NA78]|uniref:hypothetical protein n=1 Tax=Anatilimnocola sp. NA78 TaxID=3415683 RepID=UPI003CE4818B
MDFFTPRQRAVLFEADFQSGATIGHYCTVIEILADPRFAVVYLAHRDAYQQVAVEDLLPIAERDSADFPLLGKIFEILFHTDRCSERALVGEYQIGSAAWQKFCFQSCSQPTATYQLNAPVAGNRMMYGELTYRVPESIILDRNYVRRAFADLFHLQASNR